MKKDIHPKYNPNAKAVCICGHSFAVGSTLEKIEVEICSQCHPFYTGEEKVIDRAGRVERFKIRREEAKTRQEKEKEIKKARAEREKAKKKKEETENKKSKIIKKTAQKTAK